MVGTLDLTNGAVLIPEYPGDPATPRTGEVYLTSDRLRYRSAVAFKHVAHLDEILVKVIAVFNQSVPAGTGQTNVTFPSAQPDTNYHAVVTPSWNTTVYVTDKSTTGFTINYGTAPASAGSIDITVWRLPS
jgi:hypothetical protein